MVGGIVADLVSWRAGFFINVPHWSIADLGRTPHPGDRRAKQVALTPAGRRMLVLVDQIGDEPRDAFARLPAAGLALMRRALEKRA